MNVGSADVLLELNDSQFDRQVQAAVSRATRQLQSIPEVRLRVNDSDLTRALASFRQGMGTTVTPNINTGPAAQRLRDIQAQINGIRSSSSGMNFGAGAGGAGAGNGGQGGGQSRGGRGRAANLQQRGYRDVASGGILTSTFTAPAIAGIVAGAKATGDFNEAMQHLITLTEITRPELDGLKRSVLGLSADPKVRQGPTELADALYYVSSTGLKGADAMTVLKASAYGASAGLGKTQVVANTVTSVLDAYGLSADKAARVTDTLTEAVRYGKGEADKYAAAFPKVIALAAQAGVSFEEVAAQMASATRVGLTPSESATALRQIFSNLINPSEKAKKAMKELGTSVEEVRASLRDKGLFNTLKDLSERTGGRIGPIAELFGSIRGLTGFLSTTGTATLQEYQRTLLGIQSASGSTATAAGTAMETFNAQMDKLKSTIERTAIEVGTKYLPAMVQLAKVSGEDVPAAIDVLIKTWDGLSDSEKTIAKFVATILLLAGPIKMVAGTVEILAGAFGSLFGGLLGIPAVATAVAPLIAFASNPYVLALVGGALVLGGIVGWSKFKTSIAEAAQRTHDLADNADHLSASFNDAFEGVTDARVLATLRRLQEKASDAGDDVKKLDGVLKDTMDAKREIQHLGLAPYAADPLLSAIDSIIKEIEARKIHIGITPDKPTPTSQLDVSSDSKSPNLFENIEELGRRAKKVGYQMPAKPNTFDTSEHIRDYYVALGKARDAVAKLEQQEGQHAAQQADLQAQQNRAVAAQRLAMGKEFPDVVGRALENQKTTVKDLIALRTQYDKLGKSHTPADVVAVRKVNARIKELNEKGQSDKEKARKAAADAAADAQHAAQIKANEIGERLRSNAVRDAQAQMSVWQKYGNQVEGVLGRVVQLADAAGTVGEKTARAKMEAEMAGRAYADIPKPLRDALVELAGIEYRMKKITDMRDGLRGLFQDMTDQAQQAGLSTSNISKMAGDLQRALNLKGESANLFARAQRVGVPLINASEDHRARLSSQVEAWQYAGKPGSDNFVPSGETTDRGLAIASRAMERHLQGSADQYRHYCQQLLRTTVQEVTPEFNRFFASTALQTMRNFQRAGVGHSYQPGERLAPGSLLYTARMGGGAGHAMLVGPDGRIVDNVGRGLSDASRRKIDWVVPPSGHAVPSNTLAGRRMQNVPELTPVAAVRPYSMASGTPMDDNLMPRVNSRLSELYATPLGEGETRAARIKLEQFFQTKAWEEMRRDMAQSIAAKQSQSRSERNVGKAIQGSGLDSSGILGEMLKTSMQFTSQDVKTIQGAPAAMRANARHEDLIEAPVKAASDKVDAAVKDMARHIRLIGQDNNPLALLFDQWDHEDKATPPTKRNKMIGAFLLDMRTQIEDGTRRVAIEARRANEILAKVNPAGTEGERARQQAVAQFEDSAYNSPEFLQAAKEAKTLRRNGQAYRANNVMRAANAGAKSQIAAQTDSYDKGQVSAQLTEDGAATRAYTAALKSLNAQRKELGLDAGMPEAAIADAMQMVADRESKYAELKEKNTQKLDDLELHRRAREYANHQQRMREIQREIDAEKERQSLDRDTASAGAQASMINGAMSPGLQRALELKRFEQEYRNNHPDDEEGLGKSLAAKSINLDENSRLNANTQAASRLQELAKATATLGDENGLAALKYEILNGALKDADDSMKAYLTTAERAAVIQRAQLSAFDAVTDAQTQAAASRATSETQRLRIQYAGEDRKRKERERLNLDARRTPEEESLETSTRSQLLDIAKQQELYDAIHESVRTGFENGIDAGLKSVRQRIVNTIYDNLSKMATESITSRLGKHRDVLGSGDVIGINGQPIKGYQPAPQNIVEKMMSLAGVTGGSVGAAVKDAVANMNVGTMTVRNMQVSGAGGLMNVSKRGPSDFQGLAMLASYFKGGKKGPGKAAPAQRHGGTIYT